MHHDPVHLRNAILYSWDDKGRMHITLLRPWDGARQFPSYATTVRVEALTTLALGGYTREEQHKLWIADCTGPDVLAAVKDDILCARAGAIMSRQAELNRADAREREILEGEFHDPAWVKRLRAKLREKGLLSERPR